MGNMNKRFWVLKTSIKAVSNLKLAVVGHGVSQITADGKELTDGIAFGMFTWVPA